MSKAPVDNDSQLESASLKPQEAIQAERVEWEGVIDPSIPYGLKPKSLSAGDAFNEGFSVCYKVFAKREQDLVRALRAWLKHPDLVPKYYWEDAPLADIEVEHELSKQVLKNLGYGDKE